MKKYRSAFDLFLISSLGLFVELIFIRWAASELRMLAFYKNFALIAAFLGLGLGFAFRRRRASSKLFERFFFLLLTVNVILIQLIGRTPVGEIILLNRANAQEFIWAGTLELQSPQVALYLDLAFYALLLALYVLITILFIPLGELTARKFAPFRPLPGYTINVIGSLLGILVYSLISFLGWPPFAWFMVTAVVGTYFLLQVNHRPFEQTAMATVPVLLTLLWPTGADITLWSPYYRIDIRPEYASYDNDILLGYELSVNKAWHQYLWNLSPEFVDKNYDLAPDHFDSLSAEYDTPFQTVSNLDDVLVVGAGTGNDVAAALRAGAKHITAVEIDPLILKIGQENHPEGPYSDSQRVKQVVQDARSFFRRDDHRYDLIVFGLLDSHTLFSTASSVRLDNFVYTKQSLAEARDLLKEDGILALSFGVPPTNEWLGLRLFRTLTDVFGHPPQVYEFPGQGILFLTALERLPELLIDHHLVKPRPDYVYQSELAPLSDDWPYLYLKGRTIPNTYLIGLTGAILISLILIRRVIPDFHQLDLHFFFMGAAFFLLETKSVTEMALLFGSTWIVNAVVIAAILTMIVLANLVVERFNLSDSNPFYVLLFITLLMNYFVPVNTYLGLPLAWRIILVSITQAIPLFFAGLIFAISFQKTTSVENTLGSNLLGAVLGGIFEYGSLILGIRSLYLLALVFYLLSALTLRYQRRGIHQPSKA